MMNDMERTIKFRGKTTRGAWIFGNIGTYKNTFKGKLIDEKYVIFQDLSQFQTDNFCYVVEDYRVIKYTIGQYTGLKDKNGKEIYDGDIVRSDKSPFSTPRSKDNLYAVVEWLEHDALFALSFYFNPNGAKRGTWNGEKRLIVCPDELEVIGNIFDNLELLKEE